MEFVLAALQAVQLAQVLVLAHNAATDTIIFQQVFANLALLDAKYVLLQLSTVVQVV